MCTIGKRVDELLKALGITQTEFANKLHVSSGFVSQLRSDKTGVSDRTISDICAEFSVNEEWLRDGTGEMFAVVSRDDVIAAYLGQLLSGDDASTNFQRRLIQALAKLTPEQWQEVEAFARGLLEDPGS